MPEPALLIADPNSPRRNAIMQKCAWMSGVTVLGAATLSEAYRLAESNLPKRMAVAAEIANLRDFESLFDMITLLGADLVVYGEPYRAGSRQNFFAIKRPTDLDGLTTELGRGLALAPRPASRPPAPAVQPHSSITRSPVSRAAPTVTPMAGGAESAPKQAILIGASTGGIPALEAVLRDFPADCPPTLIVQHIRPGFAEGLVRRLNHIFAPQVLAAEDGDLLRRGAIYIAANPDRHLGIVMRAGLRVRLIDEAPVSGHRPSVDVLFSKAASIADRIELRAALLTGMDADGAEGMCALRRAGARTIAQDKESSVVWGMPRVAVEMGGASEVLALPRIGRALLAKGTDPAASPKRGRA